MRGLDPRIPIGWHSARLIEMAGASPAMTANLGAATVTKVLLVSVLATGMAASAHAQPVAEFYQGKTIQLMVGFGTGGEDDLWARTISRHLGNHIPGNPTVVVQHMPGSGGLLVANRLYNTAAKDGTAVGMINRGIPFEPLLGGQGAQFDALKFTYVGSPGRDTTVCAARKDAQVQNLQDLYSSELTVGGTGSGADTAIYPQFLSALLGMKFKLVQGYKGSGEIQIAMERKEVEGICLAYDSLLRGNLARQNQINVLLQAAVEPDPRLKDVPLGLAAARTPEDQQALALFFARVEMGRPFVLPPGVPADRVAAMRAGFEAMLRDKAFLEEADKQRLRVVPISGDQMTALLAKAYKAPPAIVQRTMRALGRAN
jgi:tripartite-type tricarboxylate transporter receptor subunit TctC